MSKSGYSKLLRKYEQVCAERDRLRIDLEADKKASDIVTPMQTTETIMPPRASFSEKLFRFIEHGLVLAALGILGPLMVPLSKWFLALPAICLALAWHRVEAVKGRSVVLQGISYIGMLLLGASAGFGAYKAIEKQENELVAKIAALIPKQQVVTVFRDEPRPPPHNTNRNDQRPFIRHPLSGKEIDRFKKPLMSPDFGKIPVHLARPAADETTCVYAAQFIQVFRDAGWSVPEGIVERQTLLMPYDGVRIFEYTDTPIDYADPKGTYAWMAMTCPMVAIAKGLASVGIMPDVGHGNTLPKDVLTIYFGPPNTSESTPSLGSKNLLSIKCRDGRAIPPPGVRPPK